jgi:hypothetical protein
MILVAKGIQMRVIYGEDERARGRGNDGNDWADGYQAGKRGYELAAGRYRSARDYLTATAADSGRLHSWIDGFKTGWSVARDD